MGTQKIGRVSEVFRARARPMPISPIVQDAMQFVQAWVKNIGYMTTSLI